MSRILIEILVAAQQQTNEENYDLNLTESRLLKFKRLRDIINSIKAFD